MELRLGACARAVAAIELRTSLYDGRGARVNRDCAVSDRRDKANQTATTDNQIIGVNVGIIGKSMNHRGPIGVISAIQSDRRINGKTHAKSGLP